MRELTFNRLMSLPNLLSLSRIPLGGAFWLVLAPTARDSIWAFLVMGSPR